MHEVRYSSIFAKEQERLKKKADRGSTEAKNLLVLITDATRELKADREAGKKIPRRLWPREYVQKYGVTNLWKYTLIHIGALFIR